MPGRLELSPEEMRRMGYAAIDMLVDRIAGLSAGPAWKGGSRAEMEALLREAAPDEPHDFDALIDRLQSQVFEYAGRIDHPRFFAFVPSSPTWPGILGDLLASGFNIFQGTWLESAGPSTLELIVIDWFRGWIGLPDSAGGLLTSGGSAANLTALVCAREARLADGAERALVYVSDQTHSSVERALRIIGWPKERIRVIPPDAQHRLPIAALRTAMQADAADGWQPFLVVANAGATSTGAVDPLDAIADACAEHGAWLHVDGAYGGFAVLTARGKQLLRGIERADSVTLDPHKWLFQNYEAGCLLMRDAANLHRTFQIMHPYLQDATTEGDDVNFADRGIQLTRSARAVKVWLSLQTFGVAAFRAAIDDALDLARRAEAYVRERPAFELLSGAELGIVCFRRVPEGDATEDEIERVNQRLVAGLSASGVGMISSTRVRGHYALRLCIMNHRSAWADVETVLRWLEGKA